MDAKAFAQRLDKACTLAKLPATGSGRQMVLAEALDVSQQAVSKWLRGASKPQRTRVEDIANFLGVSFRWLDTGDGQPNVNTAEMDARDLNPQERRLIRLLRSMPAPRRDDLVDLAELWAHKQPDT